MPIPSSLGWYEIPNTKLATVAINYPQSKMVIIAWGGGIFDTLRNRTVCWGGGHGDYSGNEIYAIDYDGTAQPLRLTDNTNPSACSQPSCDGGLTPDARHTYHCITYVPSIDCLWSWAGALSGNGFGFAGAWLFHFATMQWEWITALQAGGTTNPNGGITDFSAYDSVTGNVVIWDGRSLITWDPSNKNVWTMRYYNENGFADTQAGAIDTTRHRLYVFPYNGGSGNNQFAYLDLNVAIGVDPRNAVATPTGDNTWMSSPHPGMVYDASIDRIVIWGGGDIVYEYNPATNVSTAINAYTGGPVSAVNGTFGRWAFSPTLGVYTVVNDFDQNAFAFRLYSSTPDTIAPSTPSSPSATTASQSQIDLSWTASTDDVAVTAYLIERCSGSACSNFTQIVSISTTTYSDVGLSASTLYRYRIRATDSAGNLSSYSTIVSDTTSSADITAPTDPANLIASVQSYQRIDLSWDISTDAVGVLGYRVERCTGSVCSNFAQIAAPTSNSYSDVGLTQNTIYRYRVRAVDAALNFSGYSNTATATTTASIVRNIGTGQTYSTIGDAILAAAPGDTIEADAAIYANETFDITQANLTLRGLGGLAHLKWDTGDYTTATNLISNGQGIIRIMASGVTLENLEFSGAKVTDNNGAGVRYSGGGDLTIRRCYFHNNQNGVLGQGGTNSTLLVEFSRFESNGFCVSGDCAHNIYIGYMGRFIFRYNTSLNPIDGHCVKSRAAINYVQYNHLSTKDSNGSYECEFPNGHQCYVMGNIIEQGDGSDNSTMISYGAEGLTSPDVDVTHALYICGNTLYNWRSAGVTYIQTVGTPSILTIQNNARSIGGTFLIGSGTTTTNSNNIALSDAEWVDINSSDFHLVAGAAAIDAGINPGTASGTEAVNLMPAWEYVETSNRLARLQVGAIDAGAYEFGNTGNNPLILLIR